MQPIVNSTFIPYNVRQREYQFKMKPITTTELTAITSENLTIKITLKENGNGFSLSAKTETRVYTLVTRDGEPRKFKQIQSAINYLKRIKIHKCEIQLTPLK
jgi:hypothetical protein